MIKVGQKIGHLTYLGKTDRPKYSRSSPRGWGEFQCDCGNPKVLVRRETCVVNGATRSCGCASRQTIDQLNSAHVAEARAKQRERAKALAAVQR